jgi:hypothetical protein
VKTTVKGSRWHIGKICAAISMPPQTLAQRMLGRKLSGGGGSRMAILLMVVRGYHFDHRLVVGRPALKK